MDTHDALSANINAAMSGWRAERERLLATMVSKADEVGFPANAVRESLARLQSERD